MKVPHNHRLGYLNQLARSHYMAFGRLDCAGYQKQIACLTLLRTRETGFHRCWMRRDSKPKGIDQHPKTQLFHYQGGLVGIFACCGW